MEKIKFRDLVRECYWEINKIRAKSACITNDFNTAIICLTRNENIIADDKTVKINLVHYTGNTFADVVLNNCEFIKCVQDDFVYDGVTEERYNIHIKFDGHNFTKYSERFEHVSNSKL